MKVISITTLLIIFVACEAKIETNDSLEGTWFYIDLKDTTYNEIYFTKELLIHNLSSMGISKVYEYEISNDSILVGHEKEFFMELMEKSTNEFSGRDKYGNLFTMERFNMDDNSYKKFMLPEGRIIKLQRGRVLRGNKTMLERGLIQRYDSASDSVLFIPEVEN